MSIRFTPVAFQVPVVPHPTGAAKLTSLSVSQEFPKNSESPLQNRSERFVRFGEPFQDKLRIASGLVALHCTWKTGVVTVRVASSTFAAEAALAQANSDAAARAATRTRCISSASFVCDRVGGDHREAP
jgi:hypothetical protein